MAQNNNLRTLAKTIDGGVIFSIESDLSLNIYYEDGTHKHLLRADYDTSYITDTVVEYKDALILYYKKKKPKVFYNHECFKIKDIISTNPVEILEVYVPGSDKTEIISPYMNWFFLVQ